MPIIGTLQYSMYKLMNIIWKSGFMDSNLLQCDPLLLLVAVAYRAVGPLLAC